MEEGPALLNVGRCLVMRVPSEAGWQRMMTILNELKEGRGEEVILDTGPQVLGARQLVELERILSARGYRLVRVVHGPAQAGGRASESRCPAAGGGQGPALSARDQGAVAAGGAESAPRGRGRVREPGERTLVRRGPLRSGQVIHYRGNVVILGDVNPGAQVVATGDVIVLGALRGVAHAGADGSRGAVVAALRLCPTQLRIADLIRRAPEGDREREHRPELARVRESEIVVESL
ncbi:MAG: septum site-determining protein MinC [Bacillota bacterium]